MAISLVIVYPAGEPDNLGNIQIFLQVLLDLFPAQLRIPPLAKETGLRNNAGPLPVHMNRASLQNEVPLVIDVPVHQVAKLSRHLIVLIPGKIQSVVKASPCVESPVHSPYDTCVIFHKGGRIISGPGIIAGHLHHSDLSRQH